MAENWLVEGPRIIDVGSERERVEKVVVAIVGGHVDIVTHEDGYGARVEVSRVEGLPVRVTWDGRTLKVMHGKDAESNVFEALRRLVDRVGGQQADVSISVPASAHATLATVSAPIVVSGLRRGLVANTVSGEMTISDVHGTSTINTVSGATECAELVGEVKINSVSGAVTVQGSNIPRARVNTVSGEVALDLVNTHLDVQSNSVSGDLTIRAPFSGYAVTATSATGQVIVDGQSLRGGRRGGMPSGSYPGAPGQSGTLRSGAESLRLRANSLSGDVVLLRATRAGDPGGDAAPGGGAPSPQDAPAPPWAGSGSRTPQDAPVQDAPAQEWTSTASGSPAGHKDPHEWAGAGRHAGSADDEQHGWAGAGLDDPDDGPAPSAAREADGRDEQ